jgi:hypothetical protein
MRRSLIPIAFAVLLIVGGVLLLLQNLNILTVGWEGIWAILFTLGGLTFVAVYLSDRENWWALIPGFTLLGIGGLIGWEMIAPNTSDKWGGAFFLGAIALAFWIIYLTRRENWWALIPGGVLLTLALVAGISDAGGFDTGGVFFLGLAATFGLVYLLPTPEGRMKWAIIPAAILGIMGLFILVAATSVMNYLWPAALIAVGLFLVFRTVVSRQA